MLRSQCIALKCMLYYLQACFKAVFHHQNHSFLCHQALHGCSLIAHIPGALGSTVPGQLRGPSSLFFQLSNTLFVSSAEVTQFLKKPSCLSCLWSATNSFCFRKSPPRDTGVVSPSPAPRGCMDKPVSVSTSRATAKELLGGQKPYRPQTESLMFPTISFLLTCPHVISLHAVILMHLGKQESHNQCACSILFLDPAGPSHISGCKINTSVCVCSVFPCKLWEQLHCNL